MGRVGGGGIGAFGGFGGRKAGVPRSQDFGKGRGVGSVLAGWTGTVALPGDWAAAAASGWGPVAVATGTGGARAGGSQAG